jgi:hypothetical protein
LWKDDRKPGGLIKRKFLPITLALLSATVASGSPTEPITRAEIVRGRVTLRAATDAGVGGAGEAITVDTRGRIFRSVIDRAEAPGVADPDHITTRVIVARGGARVAGDTAIESGLEAEATGLVPGGGRLVIRPVRPEFLARIARFLGKSDLDEEEAGGLSEADRNALIRVTHFAAMKLEAMDAEGLMSFTAPNGRFAGRMMRDYRPALEALAASIRRMEVEILLRDFRSTSTGASSRFVMAMDLAPITEDLALVRISGAGTLAYSRTDGKWSLAGAEVSAWHVSSDLLPPGFVEARRIVLGY